MRTCSETTKADLAALGWFPHCPPTPAWAVAAFWDAMHNRPMSRKREDRLRVELGLRPLPAVFVVPACPDCGSVHHARCNGNGGTAVVLAAGETVRRPTRRKRPVVRRPWMGVELSAAMDAAGMSDATVRWLVTRHIYEQELAGKAGMEGGV